MKKIHGVLLLVIILIGCKPSQPAQSTEDLTVIPKSASDDEREADGNPGKLSSGIKESTVEIKNFIIKRDIENYFKRSNVFSGHFTGFSLYDLNSGDWFIDYNGDKYFTPASNIKILTLYAVLKTLKGRIPTALISETSDTLFIRPVGDPTVLHPEFTRQPLLEKIKDANKTVVLLWPKESLNGFGEGWMWDDYESTSQAELAWFPLYGNVVTFEYSRNGLLSKPEFFSNLSEVVKVSNGAKNDIKRSPGYNYFTAEVRYPNWSFSKSIPYKYSPSLAVQLLEQETGMKTILKIDRRMKMDTLFSVPVDSVLRKVMQDSDNFLAEQLLIMAAWKKGFTNTEAFREYVAANWLTDIDPVWIDGSGLSRYNLIRPRDKVKLLIKLYEEFGWYRIHNLFAKGGESGTLQNWYPNRPDPENPNAPVQPYIIAKTGTLANNHNLSGYLQTKSGKLLVFSFMNNNYVIPGNELRRAMQDFLEQIRDSY